MGSHGDFRAEGILSALAWYAVSTSIHCVPGAELRQRPWTGFRGQAQRVVMGESAPVGQAVDEVLMRFNGRPRVSFQTRFHPGVLPLTEYRAQQYNPCPGHTLPLPCCTPRGAAKPVSAPGREAPIGVFDSGVGGLCVLRAVRTALPGEDLLYVADSRFAPYGERSTVFIRERAEAIAGYFVAARAKAIVVACNTATAVAAEALRGRFAVPIVAMEPAVKPAVAATRSGVIGVLGTHRTLVSERLARLVEQHAGGVEILLQPCPGLVEQVEAGDLAGAATRALVERYVGPLVRRGVDTLVLGCTHYAFLLDTLAAVAGCGVTLIDPAVPVASEVVRRLTRDSLLAERSTPGRERFLTSGTPGQVAPVMGSLWGEPVPVGSLVPMAQTAGAKSPASLIAARRPG